MKKIVYCLVVVLLVAGLELSAFVNPASPASPAITPVEFYKGKVIKIYQGGGSDSNNALLANAAVPWLKEYTGAGVIVIDMPGGGGVTFLNYMQTAKPDGLTIGKFQFLSVALNDLFEEPGIKYDSEKYVYLGGMQEERHIFLVQDVPAYNSIKALKAAKNIKLGGMSPRGNLSLGSFSVAHILDLDAKVVTGYKSPSAEFLPVKQGELAGGAATGSLAPILMRMGGLKPLFWIASKRFEPFPNVPAITELIDLPTEKLPIVDMWTNRLVAGAAIWCPPGTPMDRVTFMREVYKKVFNNPDSQKRFEAIAGYGPLVYLTGEEAEARIKWLKKGKKEILKLFLDIIEKYRSAL